MTNAVETVEVAPVEVTEVEVAEVETLSHDAIIERLENNQKELEQTLAEREQSLAKLEKEMKRTDMITSLASEGLSEFSGLFDLTDTNEQVAFLKNAVNQILVKNSYKPTETATQDEYTQAITNGDVQGALKSKFTNFFKK